MKPAKHKRKGIERNSTTGKIIKFVYLLILIISFFKIYPYVFDEKIDLNGDNTQYYLLGKSIAQGDGFSDIKSPEKPPSNRFPPGYPLIISSTIKLFSDDISTIKYANGFLFLASIVVLYFFLVLISKNIHLSFVTSLLVLFNSHLLKSSVIMMSSISFLFFSLMALYFLINLDFEKPFYKNLGFYLMLLFVAFSYHIRSAGLALVGGVALALLLQKKWKYLGAYIAGFIFLCLPWFIRGKVVGVGGTGGYLGLLTYKNPYRRELGTMELGDWFTRVFKNFERYVTHEIPNGCFSFIQVKYNDPVLISEWIVGIIIIGIIVFGLVKLKSSRTIIFSYLLGSFGIFLLWPDVWYGVRFVMPVLPILIFLFIYGVYLILLWLCKFLNIKNQFIQQALIPLSLLLAIPLLIKPQIEELHKKASYNYPPNYQSYFKLASWSKKNLPDTSLIACRKPGLYYVFASRFSCNYKRSIVKEEVINDFINKGVDYVVIDELGYSSTARNLVPAMKSYPMKFKKIKQIGKSNTSIYEFRPDLGYDGEWKDGERSGYGKYVFTNGQKYEGQWDKGVRNGYGTLTLKNGYTASGEWKDDKMNGEFEIRTKDNKLEERAIYKDNKKIKIIK